MTATKIKAEFNTANLAITLSPGGAAHRDRWRTVDIKEMDR